MPNLSQKKSTLVLPSGLVRRSANLCPWYMLRHNNLFLKLLTNYMTINLNVLVLSWNTSFSAMCIVVLLSPYRIMGHSRRKPIFVNKSLIQIISNVTFTIALNFDSTIDWETTLCFLLFYDTRFPPRKTQYHVINLLPKEHHAESTSEKHATRVCSWFEYRSLLPKIFFKYLKILIIASKWVVLSAKNWLTTLIANVMSGLVTVR